MDRLLCHRGNCQDPVRDRWQGLARPSSSRRSGGIEVVDGPYETVGGFLMHQLGRIPEVGDKVFQSSAEFEIESIEGKRAGKIRMIVTDHGQSNTEANSNEH